MSVTLTEPAADRVRRFLHDRGHGVGLRIGVKLSGCTGFAYIVDFADSVEDDDAVFESFGVAVLVDPESLQKIDGTEIDFQGDGINQGFQYNNPNVKNLCGCGQSFGV